MVGRLLVATLWHLDWCLFTDALFFVYFHIFWILMLFSCLNLGILTDRIKTSRIHHTTQSGGICCMDNDDLNLWIQKNSVQLLYLSFFLQWTLSSMSLFRFLGSKLCDLCLLYICCISIMQSDARRIVGTMCLKCNKRFNSTFAYQQHRRSWRLRATACYSLDEQGSKLVASRRPNLSTAAAVQRSSQECFADNVRTCIFVQNSAKYDAV